MTSETGRMVSNISGNPIPFLIPIILTVFLLRRHHISFKSDKLKMVLGLTLLWSFAVLIKFNSTSTEDLSYMFFIFYALIIAYIHVRIYGKSLFIYYEEIMVVFAKISIVLWIVSVLLPGVANSFFHLFPETTYGNNFLYVFCYMDPNKGQWIGSLMRNAGCSWEPGRYAISLVLALMCNFSRKGITLRDNKNLKWLLIALATTLSTTGYTAFIVLFSFYFIRKMDFKRIFLYAIVFIPLIYALFQLDFMASKIDDRLNFKESIEERYASFDYSSRMLSEGEYNSSLDRFESMYFEWMNIQEDPILGYTKNIKHSWFYQNLSTNFMLPSGLLKIISFFGLFLGFFFYYCLFKSSIAFSKDSLNKSPMALFAMFIIFSISYIPFCEPIYSAFWFYGLFKKNNAI